MLNVTDVLAYLEGLNRGRQDALAGQPPVPSSAGDYATGYRDGYRCFAAPQIKGGGA